MGGAIAQASFHEMQIEQVIGGVNGDTTAQAIQLRTRAFGQNLVSQARIRVSDANGLNPIMIHDFTTNPSNNAAGARILIASANFANYTDPALVTDFTMTNLIPESYLAAGSLTYESNGGIVYWRLSWGGAAYTGSGAGNVTNDADSDFNPPFGSACPSTGVQTILFDGPFGDKSTNNADDYILNTGDVVFINNAGTSFAVSAPASDSDGDGVPDDEDNCPNDANADQADCDGDGIGDVCAVASGADDDCNGNESPDRCDIINGSSSDSDGNGIPDECEAPPPCEGDTNGDGVVDPLDSGYVLARFGCSVGTGDPNCDAADANLDGVVDPLDAGFVLARFGSCGE